VKDNQTKEQCKERLDLEKMRLRARRVVSQGGKGRACEKKKKKQDPGGLGTAASGKKK